MKRTELRFDDIEELFDQADEDRDDHISLTEFRGLMHMLDRDLNERAVAASFHEIDTNCDGRIGFAEFRSWWMSD